MHHITTSTDCSQDQCTQPAAFIRNGVEAIVSQWSATPWVDSCISGDEARSKLQSDARALLQAVAAYLVSDGSSRDHPACEAASLIVSAERYASHYLTSGHTEVQLVLTLQALRDAVLQSWIASLTDCSLQTLAAVNQVNQAFDNALSAALDHYSHIRNQCHGLFLKTLAHDLRNPLGGLELMAQMMMQNPTHPADGMLKIACNISRSVDSAVKVAGDMYDLGNLRSGAGLLVNPDKTDLATLCRKLADELASRYPEQSIRMEIGAPGEGLADQSRITQALLKLLGYAVRHGAKHQPPETTLLASAKELVFTVRYFSESPAPNDNESLFIPISRYANHLLARRGPLPDLGLDLYIAREIIQAHEGELNVQSSGGWTTFEVRMQLKDCADR
ncbi:signal transduction histidine kinase [Paucimonas lemoignei]|uniref:histidine kinase n=1 Tax=Paucimonas lemoignei TaxID=29443 RepID=A0A4R3I5M4_PAULE|nr:HAMP domain-containing sensor histidine kinase [Paucimonas lemoignei]TCS39309.1 signal transduction histidine kinase [Paucimonas lemoignei]